MCPCNPTPLPLTCAVLHCRLQPTTLWDRAPSWEWQLAKVHIVSHNDRTYGCTTGMLVFTVITSVFSLHTLWCHTNTLFFYHYDFFYMFWASTCPSSGGQIVLSQHPVSSLSVQYSTVCQMRADSKSALIRHTVQPFTESDDTRCSDAVIIQFVLLKMGMLMLETCQGL